jgi:hypothetical protein
MAEIPENDLPANERPVDPADSAEPVQGEVIAPHAPVGEPYRARRHHPHYHHHRRERGGLGSLFWAAMLIFAGVVFLADNAGLLPTFNNADAWDWIMLGAGGLLLVDALLRGMVPDYGEPSWFWAVAGVVLLLIGAGSVFAISFDLSNWWPLILIVIGVSTLMRSLQR